MDINETYLSGVERGKRNPTITVFQHITEALGLTSRNPRRDSVGHSGWPSPRSRTRCPMRGNARVLSSPLSPSSNERTIPTGRSSLLTRRWREPDSNHRSLSSDKLRNWLEKAPELCAQGQPRCVRTREMSGGAAILTIEWLEGTIVMPECFTETLRAASEAGWSYAVQHR